MAARYREEYGADYSQYKTLLDRAAGDIFTVVRFIAYFNVRGIAVVMRDMLVVIKSGHIRHARALVVEQLYRHRPYQVRSDQVHKRIYIRAVLRRGIGLPL